MMPMGQRELVTIGIDSARLEGLLALPGQATGLVLFAHGSGSSRHSPRNNQVAGELRKAGLGTLLMDLLRRQQPDAKVLRFEFKAVRPTFDINPFSVHGQPSADGKTVRLWGRDHEGWLTMDATATLA